MCASFDNFRRHFSRVILESETVREIYAPHDFCRVLETNHSSNRSATNEVKTYPGTELDKMGFPPELLLSPEEHSSEFLCAICVQLVDYESASILKCSHVFCGACLDEWFNGPSASRSCPMCKANVVQASVGLSGEPLAAPLRQSNPLAHRILSRVRVRCPLYEQDCSWQGDYSEVHGHLTSTTAHVANGGDSEDTASTANTTRTGTGANGNSCTSATGSVRSEKFMADGSHPKKAKRQSAADVAIALKDQANTQFENRNFVEAIKLYTKAITVDKTLPVLYANRAAAYSMTGSLLASIADCDSAILLDPKYSKAYRRKAKAQVDLGLVNEALATLRSGIDVIQGDAPAYGATTAFDTARASALQGMEAELTVFEAMLAAVTSAQECMANDNYVEAIELLDQALQHTTADSIVLLRARAELGCGIVDGAKRASLAVLRRDRNNVQAYATRAMALCLSGEYDDAIRLARQALKLNPDDQYAKTAFKNGKMYRSEMENVKSAVERRDFETVEQITSRLLDTKIPSKAPIFAGRIIHTLQ